MKLLNNVSSLALTLDEVPSDRFYLMNMVKSKQLNEETPQQRITNNISLIKANI